MNKLVITATALLLLLAIPLAVSAAAAPATVTKSVTKVGENTYLIKIAVTASQDKIYALNLIDPKASIVNVFAPFGWCIVSDGELFFARTLDYPVQSGKSLEFVIHATSPDVKYVWKVFGELKQLGEPGLL